MTHSRSAEHLLSTLQRIQRIFS